MVGGKSSLAKTNCGCAGEEERLSRREPGTGSEESSSRMYCSSISGGQLRFGECDAEPEDEGGEDAEHQLDGGDHDRGQRGIQA